MTRAVIPKVAYRLFRLVGTLLGVSVIVFVLGKVFVPGDAVTFIVGGEGGSVERVRQLREQFGLDQPLRDQYLLWLKGVVTGDFGISPVTGRPIATVIGDQVVVSLALAAYSLIIAIVIGIPLGVVAAWRARTSTDVFIRTGTLIGFSLPIFVTGTAALLITALMGWRGLMGSYTPLAAGFGLHLRVMILPTLSIAIPVAAIFTQMARAAMLDVLNQRFIIFARARGIHVRRILFVHSLRNALAPIVTLIAFQFGIMVGGLIVVEEIFSLPGLGRGLLMAIVQRDFPYVMAASMLLAAIFVLLNGAADIVHAIIDPRLRRSS